MKIYQKEKANFNTNIFKHHSNKRKNTKKKPETIRKYEVNIPGSVSLFVFIN